MYQMRYMRTKRHWNKKLIALRNQSFSINMNFLFLIYSSRIQSIKEGAVHSK